MALAVRPAGPVVGDAASGRWTRRGQQHDLCVSTGRGRVDDRATAAPTAIQTAPGHRGRPVRRRRGGVRCGRCPSVAAPVVTTDGGRRGARRRPAPAGTLDPGGRLQRAARTSPAGRSSATPALSTTPTRRRSPPRPPPRTSGSTVSSSAVPQVLSHAVPDLPPELLAAASDHLPIVAVVSSVPPSLSGHFGTAESVEWPAWYAGSGPNSPLNVRGTAPDRTGRRWPARSSPACRVRRGGSRGPAPWPAAPGRGRRR